MTMKKNKTNAGEEATRATRQASPSLSDRPPGLSPTVTLDGRPLLFVAAAGSAQMLNACPILVAWTAGGYSPLEAHALRPPTDWLDKAWDHEHLGELGLTQHDLIARGAPLTRIAVAAQAAVQDRCLVLQQPGLERLWLTELLTLQPADICLHTISLTRLAILLADEIGLDEDALIKVVADQWFKTLIRRKAAADWVLAAPLMIELILAEGLRQGLIGKDARVALRTPKRAAVKRKRSRRGTGDGA